MKELLSGNEALARGALEAGIEIACGYPGTPSSEILENVAKYKEIYSEWSVNEKVAMDAAAGAPQIPPHLLPGGSRQGQHQQQRQDRC